MTGSGLRPGEVALPFDPAAGPFDAGMVFVGRMRTPWGPQDCPKNPLDARARGLWARAEIAEPYRPALAGLAPGTAVLLLCWFHGAARDALVQAPRHRDTPAGTFALRSPRRPNPVGLVVARITAVDMASGVLTLDAADCWDGTPIIDIKPWRPGADLPADRPADAPSDAPADLPRDIAPGTVPERPADGPRNRR